MNTAFSYLDQKANYSGCLIEILKTHGINIIILLVKNLKLIIN